MNIDTSILKMYDFRCGEIKKRLGESFNYQEIRDYENFKDLMSMDSFKDILRVKRSRYDKRLRTKKKIDIVLLSDRMATSKLVFGTATLSDKALNHKNGTQKKIETLNKNLDKWLNRHFDYVIVNVDYGEKNERLHYHFIGLLKQNDNVELKYNSKGQPSRSKKGYYNFELVNKDYKLGFEPTINVVDDLEDICNKRLTNYLLKINNHSNKPSTKNHRIRVLGDKDFIEYLKSRKVFLKYLDKMYSKME